VFTPLGIPVGAWVAVAALAAVLQAAYEALQNRLTADVDTLRLSYVTSVLGAALLLPVGAWIAYTRPVSVTPLVIAGLAVGVAANILALYAYLTALERADLSVVSPLRQSTPLWVAFVEPAVVGSGVGPSVVAGAAAATVGGYILLADEGIRSPLTRIRETGPLLALGTAGLYAVASVSARFVVVRIPSLLYTSLLYLGMAVGFAALARRRGSLPGTTGILNREFALLGVTTTARSVLIFAAFSLTTAAEVTVVLRLSLLLTVVSGYVVFDEGDPARRLAGATIIVVGVWLVVT